MYMIFCAALILLVIILLLNDVACFVLEQRVSVPQSREIKIDDKLLKRRRIEESTNQQLLMSRQQHNKGKTKCNNNKNDMVDIDGISRGRNQVSGNEVSSFSSRRPRSLVRRAGSRRGTNIEWLQSATASLLASTPGTLTEGKWHQAVSLFHAWSSHSKRVEAAPVRMESILKVLVEEKRHGNSDVEITIDLYNALLDAWARAALFNVTIPAERASRRAREILVLMQENFDQLKSTGSLDGDVEQIIVPDRESFSIVFHCVCRTEGAIVARRLLAWMEYLVKSGKNVNAKPTRMDYVMVLDCYANGDGKNAVTLAEGFIRHMNSLNLHAGSSSNSEDHVVNQEVLLLPDTYCYNMLLRAWNRQVQITRRGGREAAEQADRILEVMKEQNLNYCQPDLITYTSVITAWAASGMKALAIHRAEALLKEIEDSSNLEINTVVCNAVMSTWVKSRDPGAVRRTEEILHQMETSDCLRPDLISYNTHLHALSAHSIRNPDLARKAEKILQKLEDASDKGMIEFSPNRFTYNIALAAVSRAAQDSTAAARAASILRKLIKRQTVDPDSQPDTYSFNQVLNAFSRSTTIESAQTAMELLDYMNKAYHTGVFPLAKPDTDSYLAVITAFSRSGHPGCAERAEALLKEMKSLYAITKDHRIKPSRVCYNTVIDCWARSGEGTLGARKAEALLQEMQVMYEGGDKALAPTLITFNSVLNAWARSGTRCCGYKAEQYLEKMWEMYNKGDLRVKPNEFSYNTVINAISKSKNERKAQKALRVLRKMDKLYRAGNKEARPNEVTYTAVLNSCAFPAAFDPKTKRKALDTAIFTLKELQSSRYGQPNQVTYGTFIKACQNLLDDDDELRREVIKKTLEECIKDGQVGQMVLNYVPRDVVDELLAGYVTSSRKISVRDVPAEWTCNVREETKWKSKSSARRRPTTIGKNSKRDERGRPQR